MLRNIFGSCCHAPHAMIQKYSRLANRGISVGFIKSSECRIAGEHIALNPLLCLKSALRATITAQDLRFLFFQGGGIDHSE